jgi:hypothetical protein
MGAPEATPAPRTVRREIRRLRRYSVSLRL